MADGEQVAVPLAVKTSDLKVRTLSAVVMLAVAGGALWSGSLVWAAFVILLGLGVILEWGRLVIGLAQGLPGRAVWLAGGAVYIGLAAAVLITLRAGPDGIERLVLVLLVVVATDIGAYFAGRTIGGPKIAPRISPSKTWAGLIGGALSAGTLATVAVLTMLNDTDFRVLGWVAFACGAALAVVSQAGDFFESWMKRRAGVKDSSGLIPGHGGLLDRVDGLLAVCAVLAVARFAFGDLVA